MSVQDGNRVAAPVAMRTVVVDGRGEGAGLRALKEGLAAALEAREAVVIELRCLIAPGRLQGALVDWLRVADAGAVALLAATATHPELQGVAASAARAGWLIGVFSQQDRVGAAAYVLREARLAALEAQAPRTVAARCRSTRRQSADVRRPAVSRTVAPD